MGEKQKGHKRMDLKIAGIYAITVLARLDEVKAWQYVLQVVIARGFSLVAIQPLFRHYENLTS